MQATICSFLVNEVHWCLHIQLSLSLLILGDKRLLIAQSNAAFTASAKHKVQVNGATIEWVGPYAVLLDNKQLNK